MTPISPTKLTKALAGKVRLPAGAIPLAQDKTALVCYFPSRSWRLVWPDVIQSLPPETQTEVVDLAIQTIGGGAEGAAKALDVSRRTLEGWRCGKDRMSHAAAFRMAEVLSGINERKNQ